MAKRKTTTKKKQVESEYKRVRGNLLKRVRYYKKLGVYLMEDIIPKVPKNITSASVRRLKNITTEDLLKNAYIIDIETGQVVESSEKHFKETYRKYARESRKAQYRPSTQDYEVPYKPTYEYSWYSRSVIDSFISDTLSFNEKYIYFMQKFIDRAIELFGVTDVANMIQIGAEEEKLLTREETYQGGEVAAYMMRMIRYLPFTPEEQDAIKETIDEISERWEVLR